MRVDVEQFGVVHHVAARTLRLFLWDTDKDFLFRQGLHLADHRRESLPHLRDGCRACHHTTIPPTAYIRAMVTNCCP